MVAGIPPGSPPSVGDEVAKKPKKRQEPPLTRDTVIRRLNNRQVHATESPLITLQEIFEEADDKSRFVGDTMFWKYFEDIDIRRTQDTKSVEYRNLRIMFAETVFYVFLLFMATLYAYQMQSIQVYDAHVDQLKHWGGCDSEDFCELKKVQDMNTFWHWMRHELIPRAFTEYTPAAPRVANITTEFPNAPGFSLVFSPRFVGPTRSSLLLGSIRLRSLRVTKNAGCEVSKLFAHVFPDCYGSYSASRRSTQNFEPRFAPTYLKPAYRFRTADETHQIAAFGQMTSYPGDGFMVDLPTTRDAALVMVEDLKDWHWVDRATRAVVVELSTLNTNVNVIVNSRILFEFGPTGSVATSHLTSAAQVFHFAVSTKGGQEFGVFFLQAFSSLLFGVYTVWVLYLMLKTCHNFLGGRSLKSLWARRKEEVEADRLDQESRGKVEVEALPSRLWVVYSDLRKIVGPGGRTLNRIEAKTQARLRIMPDEEEELQEERYIDIAGTWPEQLRARAQILNRAKYVREDRGKVVKDSREDPHIAIQVISIFFRTWYHYLRYEWNLMDAMILMLWYVHLGLRVDVYIGKRSEVNMAPDVLGHPLEFMAFSKVMTPLIASNKVLAVLTMLMWVKLFKYLCMIDYFRLLIRIVERCAKELVAFALLLLVFFFGFAVCFFVAFGSTNLNFSTISGAFLVLFFLLIDGYKVEEHWFGPGESPLLPIVFFCYITIVYFVLLNVFLAIVLDVYAFTNHLFLVMHKHHDSRQNPMVVFLWTYWNWLKGMSLVRDDPGSTSVRAEDLQIELGMLPGIVRRKWIEKKRKMQRVANDSFAGLVLFPDDDQRIFHEDHILSTTDWMLPNSHINLERMNNNSVRRPPNIYDIPDSMLGQTISRAQLQRLMDEDETLPLLLGTKWAVEVIRKFKGRAMGTGTEETDALLEATLTDPQAVRDVQTKIFQRIDELERIPPELEVPEVKEVKIFTEELSHVLTDVQNQFRNQLTSIIEATAFLFEHLVELTQGIDMVRENHQKVLDLVAEEAADVGAEGFVEGEAQG